jgi:DNA-binding GntR family transcriptional regulator
LTVSYRTGNSLLAFCGNVTLDLGKTGLDRTSLREQCRELLRDRIVDGTIPPGERLVETTLSNQLQVSRGTLREALRHLEQQGLVVSDGRGHMSVRKLTARDVVELYDVRIALETMAAIRIAQSPERGQHVAELRQSLEPLRAEQTNFAQVIEHDLDFHRRLCELSDNRTLVDTWTHLLSRIRATIAAAGPSVGPGLATWKRHEIIVDAIAEADEAAIREVLSEHMREASARIAQSAQDSAESAALRLD